MIAIERLRFQYPGSDFRLSIDDLSIPAGEKVAVIGPSGTGKTTFLNLVAGISLPEVGAVRVDGRAVTDLGDAARRGFRIRRMGMVFQEFELLGYLNVLDNILLPYRVNRELQLERRVRERARSLAGRVGIDDKLTRPVDRLSQGERQRVAICRALLPEPVLILADEPTGNLDPANKTRVLDILFDYCAQHGTTLATVTHDHDLLGRFDRTIDFASFHDGTAS